MIDKQAVISGWSEYYAPKLPVAVTFVFNWKSASNRTARLKLKEFHARVDRQRFGSRFYKEKADKRLDFLVSPEKFKDGHPHYHGLLAFPPEDLILNGFDALGERYQAIWASVVPGGSLDIKQVWDADGWIAYASKENSLSTSDVAIWSVADFVPSRA